MDAPRRERIAALVGAPAVRGLRLLFEEGDESGGMTIARVARAVLVSKERSSAPFDTTLARGWALGAARFFSALFATARF